MPVSASTALDLAARPATISVCSASSSSLKDLAAAASSRLRGLISLSVARACCAVDPCLLEHQFEALFVARYPVSHRRDQFGLFVVFYRVGQQLKLGLQSHEVGVGRRLDAGDILQGPHI